MPSPLKNPETKAVFSAREWDLRVPSSSMRARPDLRGLITSGSMVGVAERKVGVVRRWFVVGGVGKENVAGAPVHSRATTVTNSFDSIFV